MQRIEHIRAHRAHAIGHAVTIDIDLRDRKRVVGNIRRIDARLRKRERGGNGDTARARTDIQHAVDALRANPGLELPFDQLCDR